MAEKSNKVLLQVKGLKVAYGGIQAVKGVDFEVREGELVSLIGSNGCLLYTSPSPRDQRGSRMPSSA